jgi:tRNA(adenine34) deaminase
MVDSSADHPEDEVFMAMALDLAAAALAKGEFPVGCVLVAGGSVIAAGQRQASRGQDANELDHAEMVALRQMYQQTTARSGLWAYCTLEPCLMCFGALLLAQVSRIVYAYEDVMGGAAGRSRRDFAPLYSGHPVTIVAGVLRDRSLRLFKMFFRDPCNVYWQQSLLARYTLDLSSGA